MKLHYCFVVYLLIVGIHSTNAQIATKDSVHFHNTVSLDAGGSAGYYTVNYERLLAKTERLQLGARAGFSLMHLRDFDREINPDIMFPLSICVHLGAKHQAEFAIGQSLGSFPVLHKALDKKRDNFLNLFVEAGYRYQKPGGRFLYRIYYCPYLRRCQEWRNWYGAGVSYSF